jgi:hypothetical protein|tara:strand:+ start:1039 stop:1323 length:285 start_codon:yes stop_codon:yes gene_type:complete
MGGKKTMEKRGHQVCSLVDYQVRQKITPSIVRKIGGKEVPSAGTIEVMIYNGKKKIEGGMKDIKLASQKIYDILKKEGRETTVSKKNIKKYNLV